MVIEVNKSIFDSLTETEKTVVKYINSNESNIPKMSIVDVAEKSFTSPATVSRTIKKCGLEGFSELRYKISAKNDYNHDSKKVNEILGKSLIEVTKTIENISVENVLKTVRLIKEAKRIYILARGLTELVAQEFNLKLELLGYNTFLIVDPNIMRKICKTLDKAESAVKTGAKLITCCCVKNSKLENLSDITLIGYKQSRTAIKEFEVTSRLPLFIISRAIIDYLII
ncbi:MurR/RpiR family transcriptional regulator [Clostridium botulinum]|nr:MurR/RpiR family transcriptional regulator [Clostridium botulinum]